MKKAILRSIIWEHTGTQCMHYCTFPVPPPQGVEGSGKLDPKRADGQVSSSLVALLKSSRKGRRVKNMIGEGPEGKHKAEKREKMREEGRERGSKICCS